MRREGKGIECSRGTGAEDVAMLGVFVPLSVYSDSCAPYDGGGEPEKMFWLPEGEGETGDVMASPSTSVWSPDMVLLQVPLCVCVSGAVSP